MNAHEPVLIPAPPSPHSDELHVEVRSFGAEEPRCIPEVLPLPAPPLLHNVLDVNWKDLGAEERSFMPEVVPLPTSLLVSDLDVNVANGHGCMSQQLVPLPGPSLPQREVHVVFSGFNVQERVSLTHKVRELGGQVSLSISKPEVTRLVVVEQTGGACRIRTQKYFEALLQGCWVVSVEWVVRSYTSRTW